MGWTYTDITGLDAGKLATLYIENIEAIDERWSALSTTGNRKFLWTTPAGLKTSPSINDFIGANLHSSVLQVTRDEMQERLITLSGSYVTIENSSTTWKTQPLENWTGDSEWISTEKVFNEDFYTQIKTAIESLRYTRELVVYSMGRGTWEQTDMYRDLAQDPYFPTPQELWDTMAATAPEPSGSGYQTWGIIHGVVSQIDTDFGTGFFTNLRYWLNTGTISFDAAFQGVKTREEITISNYSSVDYTGGGFTANGVVLGKSGTNSSGETLVDQNFIRPLGETHIWNILPDSFSGPPFSGTILVGGEEFPFPAGEAGFGIQDTPFDGTAWFDASTYFNYP